MYVYTPNSTPNYTPTYKKIQVESYGCEWKGAALIAA